MVQPILFSFFVFLYTDVAAMAFVLASVLAFKLRRNVLAGVMGMTGIAIRQSNVVWLVFLPALHLIETLTGNGSLRMLAPEEWRTMLRQTWIFLLGIGLFIAFVIWNGGVAIGGGVRRDAIDDRLEPVDQG